MKSILFFIFLLSFIIVPSVAATVTYSRFSDWSNYTKVNPGEGATFSATAHSRFEPLKVSVKMYASDTSLIYTYDDLSDAGRFFSKLYTIVPEQYPGSDTYQIITWGVDNIQDEKYSVITFVVNSAPDISDIPDQSIVRGGSFAVFDLDDFVFDKDDADSTLQWQTSGESQLIVTINSDHTVFVSYPTNFIGEETISFKVTDSLGLSDTDVATFKVSEKPGENHAPVLNPIGNKQVQVNSLLEFTVTATDPDNDPLTISVTNLPPGASFNPTTQVFSWIPQYEGTYPNIIFTVSDGSLEDSETITINVIKPTINHAPVLDFIQDEMVFEGNTLQFTVTASDIDNDPLTFSVENLPEGASFNPTTRIFTWTPNYDVVSHTSSSINFIEQVLSFITGLEIQELKKEFDNIKFTVSDGLLSDSQKMKITVFDVNRDPVLQPINDVQVQEGDAVQVIPQATDADNDDITFLFSAPLDNNGFWQTQQGDAGSYTVEVQAKDEFGGVDLETFTIRVSEGPVENHAPVLNPIGNKVVKVNSVLQFTVSATDIDNDPLTFSVENLPEGASFNPLSRTFYWVPQQGGTFSNIIFTVSDGVLSDSETITITVTEEGINHAPLLNPVGNKQVEVNTELKFKVSATDIDNDPLTFSAENLPEGASFNPTTRIFTWTPNTVGIFSNIIFTVSDGSLEDSETIIIEVLEKVVVQRDLDEHDFTIVRATVQEEDGGNHLFMTIKNRGNFDEHIKITLSTPENNYITNRYIDVPRGASKLIIIPVEDLYGEVIKVTASNAHDRDIVYAYYNE